MVLGRWSFPFPELLSCIIASLRENYNFEGIGLSLINVLEVILSYLYVLITGSISAISSLQEKSDVPTFLSVSY